MIQYLPDEWTPIVVSCSEGGGADAEDHFIGIVESSVFMFLQIMCNSDIWDEINFTIEQWVVYRTS